MIVHLQGGPRAGYHTCEYIESHRTFMVEGVCHTYWLTLLQTEDMCPVYVHESITTVRARNIQRGFQ